MILYFKEDPHVFSPPPARKLAGYDVLNNCNKTVRKGDYTV